MNASNGVSWWEPGEYCFGVLCQRVVWTCPNLVNVAPTFLKRFNIQMTSVGCGKPFSLFKASLWQGAGLERPPGWGKTKQSFSLLQLYGLAAQKSLSLICSFEGIKQASLMGGNAALKILPFVRKAFLLFLLGQVQLEKESAFKAPSQMFLLAASRTKQ